jgi:phage terminase small subunit
LNATQAAIRAGYSAYVAQEQGARLLANVSVGEATHVARDDRNKRVLLTQDRILEELARIALFDPRSLYHDDGSAISDFRKLQSKPPQT